MTAAIATSNALLDELREKIASLEGAGSRKRSVLPFGVPELDAQLPGGGLASGSLHEVAGGGNGAVDGAAAALFIGGIAARTTGKVVWCLTRFDLFFPALAQVGLHPDRVIFVECDSRRRCSQALGGSTLRRPRCRRCRTGAPADDGIPPAAARGGKVGDIGAGDPTMAAPDGSLGLWHADGCGNPLADLGAAVRAASGAGCRPGAMAGGADAGESWGRRRVHHRSM